MVKKRVVINPEADNGNEKPEVVSIEPVEEPNEGVQVPVNEVDERLLEAGSDDELRLIKKALMMEGVPEGTVKARVFNLRKKGKLIFTAVVTRREADKPMPVEGIIRDLVLPEMSNGQAALFNAGVEYGMKSVVAGVRLAQELSTMGVAQASPVIRMAKEMRLAEGMSAQEAGQVAAENALAGAIQYLSQQKPEKVDIATVQNPMQGMIARMIEQMFGKMFGMVQGQPGQQGQPEMGLPPGWSMGEQGVENVPGKE